MAGNVEPIIAFGRTVTLNNLRVVLPRIQYGDPKCVSIRSTGLSIGEYYQKTYFQDERMEVMVDEEQRIVVLSPSTDSSHFSSRSRLRTIMRHFKPESGKYRAEWIEEHKFLMVDLNERVDV